MDIEDWIRWYREEQDINIIPLREREKVPLIAWSEFRKRSVTDTEVKKWLAKGIKNFAAVCGPISSDLLVIDVDSEELFSKLNLGDLASKTFTVRTGKGYHIYLRMPDLRKRDLAWGGHEEIRFQGEGKYVVCAGSRHPSGVIYEHFITSPQEIKRADPQLLDEIEHRWREYHGIDKLEEKREEIKSKTKRSGLLDDFKSRVRLTDIVTRYVSKVNDYGTYWQGHCPFHHDRNPSFTVYEDTRSYYCFGCKRWGDMITFIQEKEDKSFTEAIKRIEEITGVRYFKDIKKGGIKKREIYPYEIDALIRAEQKFVTLRDTEEVLHYENTVDGAWRFTGEGIIREETEKILRDFGRSDKASRFFASEVIGHVQRSTYIDREQLNTEKNKINLLNGVYDLETEQLSSHDAGYYFTYLIPVRYDEKADCPKIKKFLGEILYEDDIKTVLQYIGYCLLPIMPYHKAMMFLGEGANGKSTLIELVRRFLGEKNTTSQSLQSIIEGRFTKAELYGKLANLYADIPKKALRETGVFKILTGGDILSAEKKFKEFFEFKNTAKLIFSANVLPETRDDTEAFFRRWLIIIFPNTFEGKRCDPKILEKLTKPEELSGFFNLVLAALRELLRDGRFHKSKTAAEIRDEYIDKSNPVQSFVTNCLVPAPVSFEIKDDVYSAFVKFCEERKLPLIDKRAFGTNMPQCVQVRTERRKKEGKRFWCWAGISLRKEVKRLSESDQDAYTCEGCSESFATCEELNSHEAYCDDLQLMQEKEAAVRRKEEERG